MSSTTRPLAVSRTEAVSSKWARRRDIPIAILAWTALVCLVLWGAGHIVRTLLLLTIAALLAYALAPGVKVLQGFIPRFLAILVMYLLVLGAISFLLYLVIATAIEQVGSLASNVQRWLTPKSAGYLSPLEQTLHTIGISSEQITSLRTQITSQLEGIASSAVPILTGFFNVVLDIVLVAVLSIYLLIDGSRVANWVRHNAPHRAQANFVLSTVQRIVGGYIRGQFILAVLVGILVGGGMFVFRVPYAVLLGLLAFVLEFIPVLGTLLSGLICTLIALTQGWLIALGVLIYFVVVHVIEGDIVGPRIVGKAVGLHPVISIAALIAGAELFGIWGALFASPIAGVLQALIAALWTNWRATNPEQFEQVKQQDSDKVDESLTDRPQSTITGET
ncbi:MAG TPA: AI-2E family transporter [Ktedonobacteraceae bacterium]|jgi:predicted PurR-regulated permease PerM